MTKEECEIETGKAIIEMRKRIAVLEKENDIIKSLLYCTKGTCDNCGFVNCENFQMQRKSEPCALYISYQDRIKKLEQENAELNKKLSKAEADYDEMFWNKNEIISKAKEIIRMVIDSYKHKERFSFEKDLIKAEQFLNSEVEK